jgi:hypothetical protein
MVSLACDGAQYSRHVAANNAAAKTELRGLLVQVESVASEPSPVAATQPRYSAALHTQASCADFGKSCLADPTVALWQRQCDPNQPGTAACLCATAATYQCYIENDCYAEAGAVRENGQPADSLMSLEQGLEQYTEKAHDLGAWCP